MFDRTLTINEVMEVLQTVKIRYQRYKSFAGKTDFETVWVDPTRDILPTLIHEAIHLLDFTLTENQVVFKEEELVSQMKAKDWRKLTRILAKQIGER